MRYIDLFPKFSVILSTSSLLMILTPTAVDHSFSALVAIRVFLGMYILFKNQLVLIDPYTKYFHLIYNTLIILHGCRGYVTKKTKKSRWREIKDKFLEKLFTTLQN